MLNASIVLLVSLLYLGMLFAIASFGDKRADQGRSVIRSPYVYTLSLGVYCTAWTFYGSVGLASRQGLDFLPVYLGPTLAALLFGFLVQKMLRITKAQGITSIADFIAARYGKSAVLAGLVTVVAVASAIPYIALQLKAVAASVTTLIGGTGDAGGGTETALLVLLLIALFSVLFGTRHIDATEHHEGMVLAVAFESMVKLAAFLIVGVYVTYVMFDGFGDVLGQAANLADGPPLTVQGGSAGHADWLLITALSGLAFLFLDRQFQVAVIENLDETHLRQASWLLPGYLLAINLFVLPIALAGVLRGVGDGDLYVLLLPMASGHEWLALVAYLGGLSAALGHDHRRHGGAEHDDLQRSGGARAAAGALPGDQPAPRPAAADIDHPPRGHPAPAAPGLRLFPAGRRVLPSGQHRPDLLLRRRPVRAGDPGRPLLEGGQSRRRHGRAVRRRRGLALHAGAADPGDGWAGRRRNRERRPIRDRAASPPGVAGPVRAGARQPRRGLEPWRQSQPGRAVRAARPPEQSRADAGRAVRRGRPATRPGRGVARRGHRGGAARVADPLLGPGSRRHGLRHGPAPARPGAGAGRRGRRHVGSVGRAPACPCHWLGQCAGDGGLGGARRGHRPRRSDADPRRDLAGDRVQPEAGAEVGSARAGHRGAARGQRAPAPARPAQG